MIRTFTCRVCNVRFTRNLGPSHPGRKYCSRKCSWAGRCQYDGSEINLECTKCGDMKSVSEFYPHPAIRRGYQYWCIPCTHDERISRVKIPADPYTRRRYALWSLYRITPAQYDEMYKRQDGCCAICGIRKEPWEPASVKERQRFLVVDHDHLTSAVRGLLCGDCNHGLGKFKEDPAALMGAVRYLRYHRQARESVALGRCSAAIAVHSDPRSLLYASALHG
jgi:Autographiviridae endonuclease VII